MQYLPPGGLGRSSELFFHHDGGVGANFFGDFCDFVRPNGTLGGQQGSKPSQLFLTNILVCNTCHQGAQEGHSSHFYIMTVVSERNFFMIFAIFCIPMVLQVVGKCLNLRDFSCRTFWYAILATRGLWKTSGVKNSFSAVKKCSVFP